jgi:hypothetical protein
MLKTNCGEKGPAAHGRLPEVHQSDFFTANSSFQTWDNNG